MKTTGKSIDIFGDSFSDPLYKFDDKFNTWMEILENSFKIKNYSKCGTGAQWCIEKLMGIDEYSDFLVFILPDMNRLSFDYLPDEEASTGSMIYNIMDKKSFDFPDEFKESIINQSNRIFEDYRSFYTSGLNRILEVLFVSFIFSKNKKYEKILIWPSSGLGYPFKNYTRSIEFPNNCYIVSRCLNLISHLEYKERKRGIFFEKDTRNNHLSHSNHVILADEIFNYLTKNEYPNPSNFEKYFI
jgi:hypothetical protein